MSQIKVTANLNGSGIVTVTSPNTNTNRSLLLPDISGTVITSADTATVTQAMLAAGVVGNGPAFSAYPTVGTSMSTGTNTKLTYDTEEYDTNNNYTNSRFTPTVAGYYFITGTIAAPASSGGYYSGMIWKNGSVYITGPTSTAVGIYYNMITGIVYCNGSTDYVELYGLQSTGGTITSYTSSTPAAIRFQGCLIRSA